MILLHLAACGSSHDGTYLFSYKLDSTTDEERYGEQLDVEQTAFLSLYTTENGTAVAEVGSTLMRGAWQDPGFVVTAEYGTSGPSGEDCTYTNKSEAELAGAFAADLGFDGTLKVETTSALTGCEEEEVQALKNVYKGNGALLSTDPHRHPREGIQWGYIPDAGSGSPAPYE